MPKNAWPDQISGIYADTACFSNMLDSTLKNEPSTAWRSLTAGFSTVLGTGFKYAGLRKGEDEKDDLHEIDASALTVAPRVIRRYTITTVHHFRGEN